MKTVALDLDGTLITCEPRQCAVLEASLGCAGVRVDVSRVFALKREGRTTEESLVALGLSAPVASTVAQTWREWVEEPQWLAIDRCFDDSLSVLARLRGRRVRTVLVTARTLAHWVPPQLSRLGLAELLDEVRVVSPSRSVELKASILVAVGADLLVGDSETDLHASRATNIACVCVDRGQRTRSFLEAQGAGRVVHSLDEALTALLA